MVHDDEDIDDRRRTIAIFRHEVIGELDEPMSRGELSERIHELAQRRFTPPTGRDRGFSARTLWSWWSRYKKDGVLGLVPRPRKDKGVPKLIQPATLEEAIRLRRELPSRSTSTLIDIMERSRFVPKGSVARSTLDHHLALAGASRRTLKTLGDKRFIRLLFERPNEFWVGDYKEAPILFDADADRWRTVHMSAFIDHYSKLVLHGEWYDNERIATLEDSFKKAILKRGLPKKSTSTTPRSTARPTSGSQSPTSATDGLFTRRPTPPRAAA